MGTGMILRVGGVRRPPAPARRRGARAGGYRSASGGMAGRAATGPGARGTPTSREAGPPPGSALPVATGCDSVRRDVKKGAPSAMSDVTADEVKERARVAGLSLREDRVEMVRRLLADALGPLRRADARAIQPV